MADRALGNPLGNPLGLGRKDAAIKSIKSDFVFFTSGSGVFTVDRKLYSFFRVTCVGGGGGARNNSTPYAGGGGALAMSPILPVRSDVDIAYSVGLGGASGSYTGVKGGDSTASFLDKTLIAGGGMPGTSSARGAGGVATGGEVNFSGGAPSTSTAGGSAAGTRADGGMVGSSGGGGLGAGVTYFGYAPLLFDGPTIAISAPSVGAVSRGQMGGGGAGAVTSTSTLEPGGNGWVRIELW